MIQLPILPRDVALRYHLKQKIRPLSHWIFNILSFPKYQLIWISYFPNASSTENIICIIPSFPDSSVGKESACNAWDPSSIPGFGRLAGEGIGYPLQYSWVSLVGQLVKNLSALWETCVRSLGWEDLLEKGKATHSSILA